MVHDGETGQEGADAGDVVAVGGVQHGGAAVTHDGDTAVEGALGGDGVGG